MAGILMGALVAALGCGGGGEPGAAGGRPITFSLPHVLNIDHPVHLALEKFAAEVTTRSNGQMKFSIHPGGTMGDEQTLCENVINDIDAFTKISSTILENNTDLAKVYTLPYLFRDDEHMWKVFEGDVGQELLDMALDQNLKGICYFDAGSRSFYTKRPVNTPTDLRGMKIRVQISTMMTRLMESLGASPQQIPFGELYTALDTGQVVGAENNIPSYYTQNHYKVAPNYIFDGHVRIPDILLMSAKKWEALAPEQQKIIMDSAQIAVAYQRELWKQKNEEYIGIMSKQGVTFTYPDAAVMQQFRNATQSVYAEFEGTRVMEYVERIRAVQ